MKVSKTFIILIVIIIICVGIFIVSQKYIIFPGLQDISLKKPIYKGYAYGSYPNYNINNNANPLYYNKETSSYYCKKNNESTVEKYLFPVKENNSDNALQVAVGGWSRVAYYCPLENVYFIRDFPGIKIKDGYAAFTIYGPFHGKPKIK